MNKLIKELGEYGVDLEVTLARFVDDEEFYIECLYTFLEDENVIELEKALKDKDFEKAFHHAHTLKGVLANLGLDKLYSLTSALVEELRNKNYDKLEQLVADIYSEYGVFSRIIKD